MFVSPWPTSTRSSPPGKTSPAGWVPTCWCSACCRPAWSCFQARCTTAGGVNAEPPDGARGAPPADLDALCDTAARCPALAAALAGDFESMVMHPLLAIADGCVAVDALALPAVTAAQADDPRAGGACGTHTGNTEVQPC